MDDQDKPPQPPPGQDAKPGPVARFFGGLLMTAGVLVILTSGACTLYGLAILGAGQLMEILTFGVPGILAGVGLYVVGGLLWKGRK